MFGTLSVLSMYRNTQHHPSQQPRCLQDGLTAAAAALAAAYWHTRAPLNVQLGVNPYSWFRSALLQHKHHAALTAWHVQGRRHPATAACRQTWLSRAPGSSPHVTLLCSGLKSVSSTVPVTLAAASDASTPSPAQPLSRSCPNQADIETGAARPCGTVVAKPPQ